MNPFAIILAAITSQVLGFFWYSQMFFGKEWVKLSGHKNSEKMKKEEGKIYTLNFLLTLLEAFILSRFMALSQARTILEGTQVGFMAWLGFTLTSMLTTNLFQNKPKKLFYIDAAYQMVAIMVMGAILALLS
ncbi:MAG: DUF1761 domain-containing protein [Candidatus Woesebacteria bacterium]|nr:MAG: DUF1761 domain-containing protein [Candidatus Woesebacteria bacterium]